MGAAAAEAIIAERDANGPFADIFDVAKRVNLSAANKKSFESLVLSGGFDSFGIDRERYMAANNKGDVFLDTLVKFGQLYQAEKSRAQMSLFGSDMMDVPNPPIPQGEPWSNIEKLNKERDLVGIYLSAHPLDEFSMILNHLCNTHCSELADKEALAKKETITFGGVVTAVRSRFSKNGSPCGFVTIEDFNGSGELALFGEEWGKWRSMLNEACTVYVSAKAVPRFRGSNMLEIKVADVQYMQSVKEKAIESITIIINTDRVDTTMVSDLVAAIDDCPGDTSLFIQLHDTAGNIHLRSKAKRWR